MRQFTWKNCSGVYNWLIRIEVKQYYLKTEQHLLKEVLF